ncbi:accessory gene regulator B family protein [Mammaliicoccus vitulinus]|uniref:accessory gene regulator B family protein n=1 Tax=Mammaliicoccus vitulinus TaxID=71237 RepID=UPI00248CA04D|nr:accessory gene regulator B family protein [Mammaliicoccus vitulinus]
MISYRNKLKLKKIFYWILSLLTFLLILVNAFIHERLIETTITAITFFVYRKMFDKQYHASSLILCSFISIIVFGFISHIEVSLSISILMSIILTFGLTSISYYIRDFIDTKILVAQYEKKLKELNTKRLEDYNEQELKQLFPKIHHDIIHIVYGYLHKPNDEKYAHYAYTNNISEATLYRYLKQVKEAYENLSK